jgi:hypothetical protein
VQRDPGSPNSAALTAATGVRWRLGEAASEAKSQAAQAGKEQSPAAVGALAGGAATTIIASIDTRTKGGAGHGCPVMENVPSREATRVMDGGRGDLRSALGHVGVDAIAQAHNGACTLQLQTFKSFL